MRLLLEQAESAGIGQSDARLWQIKFAESGDFTGLRLLLRHKAVAKPFTLTRAYLATASAMISRDEKEGIFNSLLAPIANEGHFVGFAGSFCCEPSRVHPPATNSIRTWRRSSFETLKIALKTSDFDLLSLLTHCTNSVDTRQRAFAETRESKLASDRRYWTCRHLLDEGIPRDEVSEALLDLLRDEDLGDLDVLTLFLENGASPGYGDGEPFATALRTKAPKSLVIIRLSTQYIVDDSIATPAFSVLSKPSLVREEMRTGVNRILREWNINKSSLSEVLADIARAGSPDTSLVELLVAK
jgi:hypothetical protein